MNRADIAAALGRAPLFSALDAWGREAIAAASRVVLLKQSEALWRRGATASNVALLLSGRCKVVRSQKGREVIVDVAIPGELLGAVGFTLAGEYSSTVVCLRRARALLIPTSALRLALERDAKAVAALAVDLARQVQRLLGMVDNLSSGSVERRLASVLVSLAGRAGEPFPGGVLIPLRLRRSDLASLAATTLESASRRISAWRREGIVVPQPGGYLIRDLPELRRIAAHG